MIKKNIKKLVIVNVFLLTCGLIGLFWAMVDLNNNYDSSIQTLNLMTSKLNRLENDLNLKNFQLKNHEFLKYKSDAFDSRYPTVAKIVEAVYKKAPEYGFHPNLVLGIIKAESAFRTNAVSYRGAYGLMQVNLSVWKNELAINQNQIFDIDYNIDLGLKILKRYYIEANQNIKRALHLYNNGYKYNNTSYVKNFDQTLFSLNVNSINNTSPPKIAN